MGVLVPTSPAPTKVPDSNRGHNHSGDLMLSMQGGGSGMLGVEEKCATIRMWTACVFAGLATQCVNVVRKLSVACKSIKSK